MSRRRRGFYSAAGLELHAHAGRRGLRHGHPVHHPGGQFLGLMVPGRLALGGARILGMGLPPAWYQPISVGIFTKGLGAASLAQSRDARLLLPAFPGRRAAGAAQAGGLRWQASSSTSEHPAPDGEGAAQPAGGPDHAGAGGLRLHHRGLHRRQRRQAGGEGTSPSASSTRTSRSSPAACSGPSGRRCFKLSIRIAANEVDAAMDSGRLVFVLEVPPASRRISRPAARRRCSSTSTPRR